MASDALSWNHNAVYEVLQLVFIHAMQLVILDEIAVIPNMHWSDSNAGILQNLLHLQYRLHKKDESSTNSKQHNSLRNVHFILESRQAAFVV